MSPRRFVVSAAIVLVAVLVAPIALAPVVNSADVIVAGAPLALLVVGLWPRRERRRTRPPWIADIDDTHPEAISRLDHLDGVGARRHPSP